MTGIIVTLIIVLIIALIFLPFLSSLLKDSKDLETPLEVKYKVLIQKVNNAFMGGNGTVNKGDSTRLVYLFNENMANMVIQFYYSTGHLSVILKYKYFHQELIFKKELYNMRNPSLFEQEDRANEFIEEAMAKKFEHERKVMGDPNAGANHMNTGDPLPDDPLGIVRGEFKSFSIDQRRAFIGMMYSIGLAGAAGIVVRQHPPLLQQVKILGVGLDESIEQLSSRGEDYMFSQLRGIEQGALLQLLGSCASMIFNDTCLEKMYYCLKQIGYSREYVDQQLNKMMAFYNFFMGNQS